ncbi:DNA polymerase III subunit gamma and tau [Herbiconiux sp. VKM Ac-2851]|nr:DNA polymerase III subunit gamma and tau [Herbiconiux sp. VKM Ac-2851]
MIGQSQVTDPLMTALRTNRVNHAYLFSGPRGCGKTTSARILARCLNCAEGPTDTPCGVCPSCVELGRDGPGSLDVVEIDAASHNGVDDARDLRERAVFAPARDRFKIFILDEAHMVTPQGFNALLKIVEEPPEHIKFIFATTEPDKVIGTIRSRTHHYPFRLIPPAQLLEYVQSLCESEGVDVAPGVLPLVVRAGGGSARDTLSLLDQLIAGSENNHVDYERAVALLGYTHGALLSEAVDALGTHDGAAVFDAVDRVIQTGQDPRRFVEDLLERLRDIIVVSATREQAASVLRGVPADDLEVMRRQAALFGHAELSRVADIVNSSLSEMTGATSPRLHLELMMARALVPAADDTQRGALARVERLERRIGVDAGDADSGVSAASAAPAPAYAAAPVGATSSPSSASPSAPAANEPPANTVPDAQTAAASWNIAALASAAPAASPSAASSAPSSPAAATSASSNASAPTGASSAAPAPALAPGDADPAPRSTPDVVAVPPAATPVQAVAAAAGEVTLQQLKDAWPEILEAVQKAKMTAWLVVFTAQVRALDGDVLTLAFPSENDVASFKERSAPGQGVSEYLRQAILDVLGLRVKYIARVDTTLRPHDGPAAATVPSAAPSAPPAAPSAPVPPTTAPAPEVAPAAIASAGTAPAASASDSSAAASGQASSAPSTAAPSVPPASSAPTASQGSAPADSSAPVAAAAPSPSTASESVTASAPSPAAAEGDSTASPETPSGSASVGAASDDGDEDDDEFDEDEELEDLPPEEELAPEPKAIVDSSGWTVPGLNENTAAAPAEPGPESDSAEVARMRAQLAELKNAGPAAPQPRDSSADRGLASAPTSSSAPAQRPQTDAPAQRAQQAPSQRPEASAPAQSTPADAPARRPREAPPQRPQASVPAQRPQGGAATTSWDVVAIPRSADEEPPPYDEPMPSDEPDLPPSLADILPSGGAPFGAPAGQRPATSPEQSAGRGSGAPIEQPGAQGPGPQDTRGAAAVSGPASSGARAGDPAARPGALRFEASGPEGPGEVPASGAQQSGATAPQRPTNAGAGPGGRARYGEAVVREILGANFIEEQPLPGREG